jgi:hypothetical protein
MKEKATLFKESHPELQAKLEELLAKFEELRGFL